MPLSTQRPAAAYFGDPTTLEPRTPRIPARSAKPGVKSRCCVAHPNTKGMEGISIALALEGPVGGLIANLSQQHSDPNKEREHSEQPDSEMQGWLPQHCHSHFCFLLLLVLL